MHERCGGGLEGFERVFLFGDDWLRALNRSRDVRRARRAWGEKAGIPHLIVVIGFGLGVLLAFDFNADELLCVFFWVHNGWRLSAMDFFLEGPSTILIGPL